jgi:Mrp family chromosome partitioning ATPase
MYEDVAPAAATALAAPPTPAGADQAALVRGPSDAAAAMVAFEFRHSDQAKPALEDAIRLFLGTAGHAASESSAVAPEQPSPPAAALAPWSDEFVARGRPVVRTEEDLARAGLAAAPTMQSPLRSQYRALRWTLLDRMRRNAAELGERSRILVITSALAGEGKTFTAFNIARSLATDTEYQVLLIDLDVVRQSISKALGVDKRPGIAECLLDGRGIADLACPLGRPNLSIVPVGQRSRDAADSLATEAYPALLMNLLRRHPALIVVVDSGPLLLSPEAELVISPAGALLMVVRAGSTPRRAVRDAIGRVSKQIPIGIILNGWEPGGWGDPESYYSYYYEQQDPPDQGPGR